MEAGIKVAKNKPKGASKCFQLSVILVLLNFGSFVVPVTGYTLKTCKISMGEAICIKCSPKLTAVPQDIPSTVKGFDLSANKIVKIRYSDFKDFPLLTQLDINSNALAHIDPRSFENLVSLKKLNLNNNRLITLEDYLFYGLTNLMDLRIHKNRIKWISSTAFMSLTSLKFLDISNNKLHHVAKVPSIIQHLPNLQVLYLKSNDFNTFFSWEMTNSSLGLTSLDLSQNPFAVIRMTADVFPNLTWLNIGTSIRKEPVKWDVPKTFLSRVSSLDISGLHLMFDDMKMLLESVNSSLTILRMNEMKHYHFSALINMSCIIPTMYKLQLRHDKLIYIGHDLFKLCVNVTELDVAQNRIVNVQDGAFRTIQRLRILDLSQNRLPSVPVATRNLPSLVQLDLSKNNITVLGCLDFANLTKLTHLYLYQNSISTLQECLFKDLKQLQVLRLQNNTISKLGGAFIKFFPNLRQLRLNSNQLIAIKYGEFKGLTSLQNLSLHENHIKKFDKHCFIGLRNLTEIQLQNNQIEMEALNRGFLNDLKSLRRLDLSNNHIRYRNSSKLDSPPFSQLSQLEMLAFSVQRRRGKTYLPENILQGLTNLLFFSTRNIQLLTLPKDTFTYTPQLQTLDISSNELTDLSPEVFHPIQNLKSLFISRTNLRSLDFLINANLTNVQYIQARKNAFSVLSEEVMKSLPALAFLDLQGNSFTCDCDNAWFIQWAKNDNHTQVFDGYNFECNYPPDLKGKKLLDFDDESCSVNIDFICFVSTTCLILLFMAASFTYHFLRWQLAYAYYYFLALLVDAKNKNKQTANQYDAFISYNTHDEPWVIRELMPKLEEEQGWRLCLHHRDFEPGRPIIDNITDAIYGSRKTICVISRRYLESEWCSREIQVASFRLFDEQKDVLILVFLEDIPTYELSPYYRMRRLLKKKTYLSWPRAAEHTELFWENLRQALNTGERLGDNRFLLTVVERQ